MTARGGGACRGHPSLPSPVSLLPPRPPVDCLGTGPRMTTERMEKPPRRWTDLRAPHTSSTSSIAAGKARPCYVFVDPKQATRRSFPPPRVEGPSSAVDDSREAETDKLMRPAVEIRRSERLVAEQGATAHMQERRVGGVFPSRPVGHAPNG